MIACCCTSSPSCPSRYNIIVSVVGPSGAVLSGASVTITGPSGFSASGTTDASGKFTAQWLVFGTYTATATGDGFTASGGVFVGSCADKAINLCCGGTQLTVDCSAGCSSTPSGITFTISQGGTTLGSGTAGTSTTVTIPANTTTTVTVTSTNPRWSGSTTTFTGGWGPCSANSVSVSATVASGYLCLPCPSSGSCADPVKTTLYLTDHILGQTIPITYDATNLNWNGTLTYSYPGCGSCPPRTIVITYYFGYINSGCCGLYVTWLADANTCPTDSADYVSGEGSGCNLYTVTVCPESGAFTATSPIAPGGAGRPSPWGGGSDCAGSSSAVITE